MASEVKPIPDGFESATPMLCVNDAAAALEFYKKAFGAAEVYRLAEPGGRIGHAEIRNGDRAGKLEDPFGHVWLIAPPKEDVTPEGTQKRFAAFFEQ